MRVNRGLLFSFLVPLWIACCSGNDKTFSGGGVRCKILGQSGKIMIELIGNNTDGNFSRPNENRLTFEVDEINEVDAQGEVVGKTGAKKHSINNLASQKFTFSKVDNVSYYQGVKVVNINLTAYLAGPNATLDVMVFLFLETGNVTFGNETFTVYEGSLKFNLKVKDWEFCATELDNCKKGNKPEDGAAIDITLQLKSKGKPKRVSKEDRAKSKRKSVCPGKAKCPDEYDVGGGSIVLLNKEVIIDGENMEMPDGFPNFSEKGGKKLFFFRIPKFNKTALIDPTSNLGGSEGGGGVTDGGEDSGGDGASITPMPTSPGGGDSGSASLPTFNMCVLALFLLVTTTFSIPF